MIKSLLKNIQIFLFNNKNIILNKKSKEPSDYMMQCGGCGSKIPQTVLEKIFEKNFQEGSFDANEITGEKKLVHTVDTISSIIDDLFLLGKIAAKHSLNDLIAANSNLLSAQMMLRYSTIIK